MQLLVKIAVTPLAGVWIEIQIRISVNKYVQSLPLRECGLKSLALFPSSDNLRHSPCGSVD